MAQINWKDKCWVTTIFLVNDKGQVLLTWNKNLQTWIPVGGHIDPGETPEEAVKREVTEETGFGFEFHQDFTYENEGKVKVLKPYKIQIETVPHHGHHMNFIFFGKCTSYNDKTSETDEQEKLKWFSEEDIKNESVMLESIRKSSLDAIKSVKH